MGTGQIKGGSKYYRSIGQNILIASSIYPYKNGRFGVNSPHTGNRTRNIYSEDNVATARDFFDKIAFGGIIKAYEKNMIVTHMADGSIISLRITSHSDGTPVVDINISGSSHTGGIKKQKIHFIKEDSQVNQIDVRFDASTINLMQSLVGNILIKYRCDPFIFSPSVFGIVGIITDQASVAFTNSIEVMDYYGTLEDVAVFQAELRDGEDFQSMMVGGVMIDTCINSRIMAVDIVNEHQKLFKDEIQTYDVWTIRGVIFRLEDGLELSLEKNVWFSEMITIKKGYNLIDDFAPVAEFEEDWDEGYRGECTREIITLN